MLDSSLRGSTGKLANGPLNPVATTGSNPNRVYGATTGHRPAVTPFPGNHSRGGALAAVSTRCRGAKHDIPALPAGSPPSRGSRRSTAPSPRTSTATATVDYSAPGAASRTASSNSTRGPGGVSNTRRVVGYRPIRAYRRGNDGDSQGSTPGWAAAVTGVVVARIGRA